MLSREMNASVTTLPPLDLLAPLIAPLWTGSQAWLANTIASFDPLTPLDETEAANRLYALAHLAQMCTVARQTLQEPWPAPLADALALVDAVSHDAHFFDLVSRMPGYLEYALLTLRALEHCQRDVPPYRLFIELRLQHGHALHTERPPSRLLLLHALLDDMHFNHQLPPIVQIYRGCLPAYQPLMICISPGDIRMMHSLTLGLEFALRRDPSCLPRPLRTQLIEMVQMLLRMSIRGNDRMALAETMAMCLQIDTPPASLIIAGWRRLLQLSQQQDQPHPLTSADLTVSPADAFERDYPFHLVVLSSAMLCNYRPEEDVTR